MFDEDVRVLNNKELKEKYGVHSTTIKRWARDLGVSVIPTPRKQAPQEGRKRVRSADMFDADPVSNFRADAPIGATPIKVYAQGVWSE
jgi:hypothetical protein